MLFCDLLNFNLRLELGYLASIRPVLLFKIKDLIFQALRFVLLPWQVVLLELLLSLAQHHLGEVFFLEVLLCIFSRILRRLFPDFNAFLFLLVISIVAGLLFVRVRRSLLPVLVLSRVAGTIAALALQLTWLIFLANDRIRLLGPRILVTLSHTAR